MAAAIPIVMTAVKVIGTIASVVTMVKGIKEGNLLQAVAGGFGAFMGVTSLMGSTAAAAAAPATTGAEAASTMPSTAPASWSAQVDPTQAFNASAPAATTATATTAGLNIGATDTLVTASQQPGLLTGSAMDMALQQGGPQIGSSMVDRIVDGGRAIGGFMQSNPAVTQAAGGLLFGAMQGKAQDERMAREEKAADEARARRGYWAAPTGSPFATGGQQP